MRLQAWRTPPVIPTSKGYGPQFGSMKPIGGAGDSIRSLKLTPLRGAVLLRCWASMDTSALFPVIVPRRYNDQGRWVGPLRNLKHPELALTWVVLGESATMSYVSHSDAARYNEDGVDFEAVAIRNLTEQSEEQLFTHERRVNGTLVFAAAMHPDGLGSSRLLLAKYWQRVFPQGYQMAIPERSCAIVAPLELSEHEFRSVLDMVNGCYADGTTPMLRGFYSPDQFDVEV